MADLTDIDITRLCARAMGDLPVMVEHEGKMRFGYKSCMGPLYDPLHYDSQAMALVKRFRREWQMRDAIDNWSRGVGDDLNRAICLCVARMQLAKEAK